MTSPIVRAVEEFLSDESGRKRKRMNEEERSRLDRVLLAAKTFKSGDIRTEPLNSAERGEIVVSLFAFSDSRWDAVAADVLADIMWAAQSRGYSVVDLMSEAYTYFKEEKENGR